MLFVMGNRADLDGAPGCSRVDGRLDGGELRSRPALANRGIGDAPTAARKGEQREDFGARQTGLAA